MRASDPDAVVDEVCESAIVHSGGLRPNAGGDAVCLRLPTAFFRRGEVAIIRVREWYVAKMRGVQEFGGSAVLWVAATSQVTVVPHALIAADEPPATVAAPAVAPGCYSFNMITQGHERRYVVHVPSSVPFGDGGTYPLIVALHGSAGNAAGFLDEAN